MDDEQSGPPPAGAGETETEETGAADTAGAAEVAAGADGAGAHAGHGAHGYSPRRDEHVRRLRRIEGQVRGLQRMVENDEYCIDILTQVSAGTKALQSFALALLEDHLRHCVADAARNGGPEADAKVAEATAAIARLLRS